MRLWREQGIVWAALLALSNSSLAASISLAPLDNDPAHARVAVDGHFEAGDEIKFRTEVGRLTKAVVVFNSDGGNLQAGIEIGKTIRLKSFTTAVLNGFRCASSCAFAWLGGSPRLMERGAQIGFHAAYTLNEGRASESGVGNALVGSYLTQIGLSEAAVVYITRAAPTQLTLLTLQDAERIGIEVRPFEQYAPTTKPAPQADETICWVQNNSRDALNACNRLIDAGQTGFYFHRAQIYFRNGDYDRAIADLSAFIQLNPNSVRALNDRGLSYEKKGEYDKAIADYSEVIRLVKDSALSYYNRGSAYEKKGEYDKALADFREAQKNGSTTASEDINRVEREIERSKYVVNGLDGLSLGGRASPQSNEYQEYQCTPSEHLKASHGVTSNG
jgi:tetratricopeptide (TPR) repeat protein